jgi:hypothetical protein
MNRRTLVATLAAGALAIAVAAPAIAVPPTLDQHHECAATDCNMANQVLFPVWLSEQGLQANSPVAMAQTFTPAISGPLSQVDLYLEVFDNGSPVPFDVAIVPTIGGIPHPAAPLATETVTPTPGTSPWAGVGSPAWIPVTFSAPATLTAGTLYAIVVGWQLPAASWLRWEADAAFASPYVNYPNGDAMVGTHVGSGYNFYDLFQITALSDGSTGNADFAFRTYVGAAVPTPTPTASPTASPSATPTATPFVPTQPPTDATTPSTGPGSSGWLPLVAMLAVIAGAALVVPRGTRAARRR